MNSSDQEPRWDILYQRLTGVQPSNSTKDVSDDRNFEQKSRDRWTKLMSDDHIFDVMKLHCCKDTCLRQFAFQKVKRCKNNNGSNINHAWNSIQNC